MANSLEVIEEFRDLIREESTFRWGDEFTVKDLVYHLIENGIIPPKTLRNYMLFVDFDKFLKENKGHVGNTFMDLSIKHDICEKQCRNIIYKQRYKISKSYNIKSK
tara:strand:- start:35 stop:352 length:318 start_codon:yes stop_codon:yes gene_type:complete